MIVAVILDQIYRRILQVLGMITTFLLTVTVDSCCLAPGVGHKLPMAPRVVLLILQRDCCLRDWRVTDALYVYKVTCALIKRPFPGSLSKNLWGNKKLTKRGHASAPGLCAAFLRLSLRHK